MDKEKILSTLREKLGTTNFSDRTLNTYIAATFGESEEITDDQWNSAVQVLSSLQGQFNHDLSEAKKQLVQSPQQEPKPEEKPATDETAQKLQELEKSYAALLARLDQQDAASNRAAKLKAIEAEMRAKNATDGYVIKNVLRELDLSTDASIETLVATALANYDRDIVEAHGTAAVPRGNAGSGAKVKSRADEYFEAKRKREGW